MNKSHRIRTEVGSNADKHIKVKLEQDTKSVEILSLKIDQKDLYQSFNCDYGVLIGRVLANGGVGIGNVKVSIFIPISDSDKERPEIKAVYPYSTPRDKNADGKRYNLLPRVGRTQTDGTVRPLQPFGTFPLKEEFLTNDTLLEVYETYYKYSTVTNESGDYMLFGVPTGVQTVHLSVDITDIGKFSMTPAAMVTNLGYSPNLFTDNNTKIKPSKDLGDLPHIETQEISVDIIPFCGDSDNFDIGITRQDFRILAILQSTIIIFGSAFTDAFRGTWGENSIRSGDDIEEMWRVNDSGLENTSINSKRIGKIEIDVYYYPNNISDLDINAGNVDTTNDIVKLQPTEYTSFIEDGQFAIIVTANRRKVITDEFGGELVVPNDSTEGAFTEFRGMFICNYAPELPTPSFDDISGGKFNNHTFFGQRWKFKIPQSAPDGQSLNSDNAGVNETYNENWRKSSFIFKGGSFYSVSKFHHLDFRNGSPSSRKVNTINLDPFWNTGIIITGTQGDFPDDNPTFEFPSNGSSLGADAFGAEWMNFSLHFPQHTYFIRRKNSDTHSNLSVTINNTSRHFYETNTQKIIGFDLNTKTFLRNDFHKTDFVLVTREDIANIIALTESGDSPKGFRSNQPPYVANPLTVGNYKSTSSIKYFFKGFGDSDCFEFISRLGLI